MRPTLALLLLISATAASAQVHRCKDPSGKLIFSDRPCEAGQTGEMIQRKRTQQEILQEREQAYSAEARKQNQRLVEQERELAEQQRRSLQQPALNVAPQPGNDWAARKARENAATAAGSITNNGGKWDRAAEAQREQDRRDEARRRALAAAEEERRNPKPATMSYCHGMNCTDAAGNQYSQIPGMPNQMNRSDGKTCIRAPGNTNNWNCN